MRVGDALTAPGAWGEQLCSTDLPDVTPSGFTAAEDLAPLGMNPLLLLLH